MSERKDIPCHVRVSVAIRQAHQTAFALACPEVDWLPPGTEPHKWLRRAGWGTTDGHDLYCPCCVSAGLEIRRAA